jgi:hypothetical protein
MLKGWFSNTHLENHKLYCLGGVNDFFGDFFSIFQKIILKNIYSITNSLFKELQEKEFNFFPQNCLQYERVLNIFYFDILNISKFGQT